MGVGTDQLVNQLCLVLIPLVYATPEVWSYFVFFEPLNYRNYNQDTDEEESEEESEEEESEEDEEDEEESDYKAMGHSCE